MARTSFCSPRFIKGTKFLTVLFFGLIIFFTNLYFLNMSPSVKETPKDEKTIEEFEMARVTQSKNDLITPTTPSNKAVEGTAKETYKDERAIKETTRVFQRKNFITPTTPSNKAVEGTAKETFKDERAIKETARVFQRKNFITPTTPSSKAMDGTPTFDKTLFVNNMNSSCSRRIREMDVGTLLFKNISIRSKLGRARVLEVHLEHPKEEDEFFKMEKGFFTLYCDGDLDEAKKKFGVAKKNEFLTECIASLEIKNPPPSLLLGNLSFQAGQYLIIQRWEYANPYWTIMDLLDIFIMTQRMGVDPQKLNIIVMDAHPDTPLDPFWSVLFQRLIKLTDRIFTETNDVVFENLVWRYSRTKSPLLDRNLKSFEYIQPFRSFVLKRFDIPWEARKRNCSQQKLNVLVNFRRDYQSHPRNLDGTVQRKISNEIEVIKELQATFSSKVNIITTQLDSLPLKSQLELVVSADIFFGMHGAAHSFPIFMAPGGAVIELFPADANNWHMGKVSTLSGHFHVPWANRNPATYNKTTKSMPIPAGVSSMLLDKAYQNLCAPS